MNSPADHPGGDIPTPQPPALPLRGGRRLPLALLQFTFARSGGPGGQNVNKVSTKVHLRLALVDLLPILGPDGVARLRLLAGNRITDQSELIFSDDSTRSQHTNRAACIERLRRLLDAALTPPRPRRATRPTFGSQRRRGQAKARRSQIKRDRRAGSDWD